MTTLAANTKRVFEFNADPVTSDIPVVASDIIYEGAAVGLSSGYARPFADGDDFCGFALAKVDNSSGSAGDKSVRVAQKGVVRLTVGGTLAVTDVNALCYATDDDTFSKTDSGSDTAIGRISRFISTTEAMVAFEAEALRLSS
jgi:hypothetical protein